MVMPDPLASHPQRHALGAHQKAELHAAGIARLDLRAFLFKALANRLGIAKPDGTAVLPREKRRRIVYFHILIDHFFHHFSP